MQEPLSRALLRRIHQLQRGIAGMDACLCRNRQARAFRLLGHERQTACDRRRTGRPDWDHGHLHVLQSWVFFVPPRETGKRRPVRQERLHDWTCRPVAPGPQDCCGREWTRPRLQERKSCAAKCRLKSHALSPDWAASSPFPRGALRARRHRLPLLPVSLSMSVKPAAH